MQCPNCKKQISDNSKFCTYCGYRFPVCPKCGRKMPQNTKYCIYCGASVSGDKPGGKKKLKKSGIILIVVLAAVAAAAVWYFFFSDFNLNKEQEESDRSEVSSDLEKGTDEELSAEEEDPEEETEEQLEIINTALTFTEAGETQAIELETTIEDISEIEWSSEDDTVATVDEDGLVTAVASGETVIYAYWEDLEASCSVVCDLAQDELNAKFGISPDTTADYSANLDPDEYLYYESSDFTFYYPAALYNSVTENLDEYETSTGMNVRDVVLEGDDGVTEAHFNKSERTDSVSNSAALQGIYNSYESQLYGRTDISYSEENGRFIMTGYFDSAETEAAYILVRVNDSAIYTMEIVFPFNGDSTGEDYQEKSYVVENIYRMCGFSGSNYKARTYAQYLTGETGDKY